MAKNYNDWAKYLHLVMMTYLSSIHAVTKYSTFYLIFGHPCSLPIDCMYETSQTKIFAAPSDYVRNLKKELPTSHQLVLHTMNVEQELQKTYWTENNTNLINII